MAAPPIPSVSEIGTLVGEKDWALIATFVKGLCNTVLVQAFRSDVCPPSLYAVYREGGMSFDAIIALEPTDCRARLDDVLREFVEGDLFYLTVVDPMKVEIGRHFRRHLAH